MTIDLTVNHVVTFGLLPDLAAQLERIESKMGVALDGISKLSDHVTALEARDAVHTQAFADIKTQLDGLKAQADDPAAVTAAVDALVARIDKVEAELPAPPAPGPDPNAPPA